MTNLIRNLLASTTMIVLLTASGASIASASVVTGTLTGGAGSGSTVSGTLTGSTTSGSTASGTITGTSSTGGAVSGTVSSGSSGGSSGGVGGGGSVTPQGQVLGASTGPIAQAGSTNGVTTSVPGAPNTGQGGNSPVNYLVLILSGLVAVTGTAVLFLRKGVS